MGQEHKEYTWSLIAKKLTGEATPDELKELEELLRYNPGLHYPMQTVTDLWNPSNAQDQQIAEQAFSRHVERMNDLNIDFQSHTPDEQPAEENLMTHDMMATVTAAGAKLTIPEKNPNTRAAVYILTTCCAAAAIAILIWIGAGSGSARKTPAAVAFAPTLTGKEIYTATGARTHLALPDGTRVWLNAGSRIHYEKSFGADLREVHLSGEAFFDVAPNASKPFVIHTSRLDIRVLGTSFNVKSYPSDKTTEATLIRGSIEVSILNRPSDKIVLKPYEKLVVNNNQDSSLIQDSSTTNTSATAKHRQTAEESLVVIGKPTYEHHSGTIIETSWVDNKLIFQDQNFGELARMMERWYGVSFRFDDPTLKDLQFTGNFEKETVRQALDALKLTAKFDYTIEDKQITIHN